MGKVCEGWLVLMLYLIMKLQTQAHSTCDACKILLDYGYMSKM